MSLSKKTYSRAEGECRDIYGVDSNVAHI
jgi:hypothetical protein